MCFVCTLLYPHQLYMLFCIYSKGLKESEDDDAMNDEEIAYHSENDRRLRHRGNVRQQHAPAGNRRHASPPGSPRVYDTEQNGWVSLQFSPGYFESARKISSDVHSRDTVHAKATCIMYLGECNANWHRWQVLASATGLDQHDIGLGRWDHAWAEHAWRHQLTWRRFWAQRSAATTGWYVRVYMYWYMIIMLLGPVETWQLIYRCRIHMGLLWGHVHVHVPLRYTLIENTSTVAFFFLL